MERKTYTLLLGCGRTRRRLTLKQHQERKVDLWYENKIKAMTIEPEDITGIILGQGLVIELYADAHFNVLVRTVENNTNPRGTKYEVGCFDDHPVRKGTIRSFKVWDYDKYHESGRLVRYCENHNECDEDEMCLCPGGENQKEWCLNRRKRCLKKQMYFHNAKKTIWNPDEVDGECVQELISKMGEDYPLYGYVKNIAHLCKRMPEPCVEGFDGKAYMNYRFTIIVFVLIVLSVLVFINYK